MQTWKWVYKKRRDGKTASLIKICLKRDAVLAVINQRQAADLKIQYPTLRVISHGQLLHSDQQWRGLKELWIDEIEALFERLFSGLPIGGASMTRPFSKTEEQRLGLRRGQV